jgi:hypothetical protein
MLSSLKVPVQLAQAEKEVSACRAKSDAFVPLVEMTAVRQVRFWWRKGLWLKKQLCLRSVVTDAVESLSVGRLTRFNAFVSMDYNPQLQDERPKSHALTSE